MIITCIGDVNTGKSSLIARILINSGLINNREIDKEIINNKKQWLPNIVDTDSIEQSRNMTLFSTQEKFSIDDKKYILINNPGHTNLLREIIINSSKADIAMLLISAKINETNKNITQGYNYSLVTRVNGIRHLIICITKSEFINNDNTYDNIVNKVTNAYKNQRYEKITFIPLSSKLDINISKPNSLIVNYCLFDIFKNLKNNIKENKTIKPINNILNIKVYFHDFPNILTIGYKCILYSLNKSYNVVFIDIKNDNKSFITKQNSKNKLISCILKINTNEKINNNIILVSDSNIIAYGILY